MVAFVRAAWGTAMAGLEGGAQDPDRSDREHDESDAATALPRLIHTAVLARQFGEVHKRVACQCLRAARLAKRQGDRDMFLRLVGDVREERLQAQTCKRVARRCESEAETIAIAAGAYTATGRSAHRVSPPRSAMAQRAVADGAPLQAASAGCSPAVRRMSGGSA
jgi:hypothetical protein